MQDCFVTFVAYNTSIQNGFWSRVSVSVKFISYNLVRFGVHGGFL